MPGTILSTGYKSELNGPAPFLMEFTFREGRDNKYNEIANDSVTKN